MLSIFQLVTCCRRFCRCLDYSLVARNLQHRFPNVVSVCQKLYAQNSTTHSVLANSDLGAGSWSSQSPGRAKRGPWVKCGEIMTDVTAAISNLVWEIHVRPKWWLACRVRAAVSEKNTRDRLETIIAGFRLDLCLAWYAPFWKPSPISPIFFL